MPMMVMGGNDFAGWFKAAGTGAAIQTFYSYGSMRSRVRTSNSQITRRLLTVMHLNRAQTESISRRSCSSLAARTSSSRRAFHVAAAGLMRQRFSR